MSNLTNCIHRLFLENSKSESKKLYPKKLNYSQYPGNMIVTCVVIVLTTIVNMPAPSCTNFLEILYLDLVLTFLDFQMRVNSN